MRTAILLILILFYSCLSKNKIVATSVLDFDSFKIEVPKNWIKIKVSGVDDYVGKIAIDNKDTLSFNLGFFANSLEQNAPDDYYGNNPEKHFKSKISWDSIGNHKAKILTPKKAGNGMTGIYFDSLWKNGQDIVKFNLVGNDLKKINERSVLLAFKTIRFKQNNFNKN